MPPIHIKQKRISENENLNSKKDSLFSKAKTAQLDKGSFIKKQIASAKTTGTLSLGYEYGILPFSAGDNYPSGGFKSEGKVSLMVLKLPLELMYSYTSIKNTIGLNNYFRISYDAERYKELLDQQQNIRDKFSRDQLGKLQLDQQQLAQKIEYLKFLTRFPDYRLPAVDSIKNALPGIFPDMKDSQAGFKPDHKPNLSDSLALKKPGIPDYMNKADSLKNKYDYSKKKDSIASELNRYKSQYDTVKNAIAEIKKQINQVENYKNNPNTLTNPYLSKAERILSNIKKFEIGLCHPAYSTFLVNNIPLQGINIEYTDKNHFFAFTYGTTINNLLYNPNTLQGRIQGMKNVYNYFDFGNLTAGRKILSFKTGIGSKEDSHIHAGFLLGKGRTDYLHLPVDVSAAYNKESNLVLELDVKYKFSQQLSLDAVFGKSYVSDEDVSMEQIQKSINAIFSDYRSYALLTRLNWVILKTKTKLTFTTRWVDPFFKSFGLSFLRSDNLRYEVKAEQPITKKIKYTVAYRREEDNLLKLYDYKNTLQSINNSLNIKLTKTINIRLMYAPLFRTLRSRDSIIKNTNNISTVVVSYFPRAKKVNTQFNALYSRYIISGDSSNINFENFTYTHQLLFNSGFKTDFNVSWFKNNLNDTLGNDTYLAVVDVGYTTKNKSSYTVGGKAAFKRSVIPQYGFIAKATVNLYKGLFFEASVEKIILGDYYNGFVLEKIKQFDYDASGNQIAKHVYTSAGVWEKSEYYVLDAQGNVMSIYEKTMTGTAHFKLKEQNVFGSSRLGTVKPDKEMIAAVVDTVYYNDTLGKKYYDGSNHLGNVLVTFRDKKLSMDNNSDNKTDEFWPEVTSSNDYYPFGVAMKERSFSSANNRYKFNGKEFDSETETSDFGARNLDGDLGIWESPDKFSFLIPGVTPYRAFLNSPIFIVDLDGNIEWPLSGTSATNKKDHKDGGFSLKNTIVRTSTYMDTDRPPGGTNPHIGIDYRAAVNTEFYSLGNGVVSEIGTTTAGANYIMVKYANGDVIRFLHINSVAKGLVQGSKVKEGQILGLTGKTGTKFAHLHIDAVDSKGNQIDPENRNYGEQTNAEFFGGISKAEKIMKKPSEFSYYNSYYNIAMCKIISKKYAEATKAYRGAWLMGDKEFFDYADKLMKQANGYTNLLKK